MLSAMSSPQRFALLLVLLSACRTNGESETSAPATKEAPAKVASQASVTPPPTALAPSALPVHLGAAWSGKAKEATLAALSDERLKFKSSEIATHGTIKSVCQEMGCWMEIVDGKTNAIVRMHNHAFFIPKTANGRPAKVEGKLVLVKDGKECDEANAKEASLEIDATSVQIM